MSELALYEAMGLKGVGGRRDDPHPCGSASRGALLWAVRVPVKVKRLAKAIRGHWSIENQLHWMLDVVFAQDSSRIRKGNGPEISSMLRQLALMILTQDTQLSGSLAGKCEPASWNNDHLQALLQQIAKR